MLVSIIIPTYGRPQILQRCLDSVLQKVGSRDFQLIVVVNGEDPDSLKVIEKMASNHHQIEFESVEATTPGDARNQVLARANGEFICFLDDDIELPEGYFSVADEFLLRCPGVDIFGGPDLTGPWASEFERALGIAFSSPLAAAKTSYRHSKQGSEEVPANEGHLILCNMWFRRTIFSEEGYRFDGRLFRNEENILLHQLSKVNKEIFYLPQLYLFHHYKKTFRALIIPVYRSGLFRAYSFTLYRDARVMLYFVPSLFVLYLLFLLFLSFRFGPITALPLLLYICLNLFYSAKLSSCNLVLFVRLMIIQFVINVSYGVGFIAGAFRRDG